jgi:3-ketoacyl-CoA synthase
VDHALAVLAVPALAVAAGRVAEAVANGDAARAATRFAATTLETDAPVAAAAAALLLLAALAYRAWARARAATYLVDFYCFRPPNRLQTTSDEVRRGVRATGRYNKASIDFMDKVLDISGLGEQTFLPDAVRDGRDKPVEVTMAGARAETEMVLFSVVEHVLARNGLKPTDVDALIVNCTSFNPVPSLR